MRILFVGDDWTGSNATSLRDAMQATGALVETINTFKIAEARSSLVKRAAKRMSASLYEARAVERVSARIKKALAKADYDVLLVFKGVSVEAEVISNFSGYSVHYHPDDSANAENTSATYSAAEPFYNLHITTKQHNVGELSRRAPNSKILFIRCAYDPRWHFRPAVPFARRLGFIGTLRPDRVESITKLAELAATSGVPMLLAGTGWKSVKTLRNIAEVTGPKFAGQYAEFVARAGIQIGALNSANRDTHTCRTFEVPAAGGLFVGERTDEHLEIFGSAALLYGSPEEAMDHASWALKNPSGASKMAVASQERIISGGNSYNDRAEEIIRVIRDVIG